MSSFFIRQKPESSDILPTLRSSQSRSFCGSSETRVSFQKNEKGEGQKNLLSRPPSSENCTTTNINSSLGDERVPPRAHYDIIAVASVENREAEHYGKRRISIMKSILLATTSIPVYTVSPRHLSHVAPAEDMKMIETQKPGNRRQRTNRESRKRCRMKTRLGESLRLDWGWGKLSQNLSQIRKQGE